MASNDIIILDKILEQKRSEIAPEVSPSDYFEIFTAEQLLKDYELSYEEIKYGIVGGGGDGGVDSIYLFVNGELIREDTDISGLKKNITIDLVLIQAKTGASFSETAMDKFLAVTGDLLNLSVKVEDFSKVYKASLLDVIKKFREVYGKLASRFPVLTISYFYATNGDQPHPNVARKVGKIEGAIKELFSSAQCNFEFVGARNLLELARRSPRISHSLKLAENAISPTGDVGFICLVKLWDFYSFLTDDSGKLLRNIFEANVRDYQGRTEVNDEIQESLKSPGKDEFWWLNNGITILATKATQSGKVVTIEDPQIVNGLQTSTEIYNFFRDFKKQDDERHILIRLIVPPASESRDRIIKATNSQTKIPIASLRATETIHRDIEEYFKPFGLFYDRRKNFYKNDGKPIDKIVGIPQLAQSVMAIVLQRPDDARARPSSLLKKDDDYEKVFSTEYPIEVYYFCANLMKKAEIFVRSDVAGLDERERTNLRFYLAMYASCILAKRASPSRKDLASLSASLADENLLLDCLSPVHSIYQKLGASDQVAKGTEFLSQLKMNFRDASIRNSWFDWAEN
ncbi:MAG: AIPR family protein [Acidobacteriota bacterium]|nr:AIPR family protein [Acidobacteriota bacterium]